jgi:alpha-tubulin suppressor-like RCC1 family protein
MRKQSMLVPLAVLLCVTCTSVQAPTAVNGGDPGFATTNIQVGPVGSLAKAGAVQVINLSKLYISLSSPGQPTIYDAMPLSGNAQTNVTKSYGPLASLVTWTLTATSKDQNDSVVHSGTQTFTVQPKQILSLPVLKLDAAYSMLKASFFPMRPNFTGVELLVNGLHKAGMTFSSAPNATDTATLAYDYFKTNLSQRLKMTVLGTMSGTNTTLYSGDTLINATPGVNATYSVSLQWVGPGLAPPGQATINVVLGAIGTTTIRGVVNLYDFVQIGAGLYHSLYLKNDSSLWACGFNFLGQLGDGTNTSRISPIQITTSVEAISTGGSHSLILKGDSSLWACGNNYSGQLGDGTTTNRNTPVRVTNYIKGIAAGGNHSLILRSDGLSSAFGNNSYGQLGDGTTTNRNTMVPIMNNVKAISAGSMHSLFLKNDGTVWACGFNSYGQLGDGTTTNRTTPVQILTNVLAIAGGLYHSLILKNDGTVWACGFNSYGQLGDGTFTSRNTPVLIMNNVKAISAGNWHSLFLKNDGTVWACGDNSYGQLGDGTTISHNAPIQAMSNVKAMSAGSAWYSFFLKSDGTLWACGYNYYGQLGDGTSINHPVPVQIIF